MTTTSFKDILSEAGYDIQLSTVRGRISGVRRDGVATSGKASHGRPRSLTEEQLRLLVGYVCDQNSLNEEFHILTAQSFVSTKFGVGLSRSCVYSILRPAVFSSMAAQTSTSGLKLNSDELCSIARKWLDEHREMGLLETPRNKLRSIDFTFTGHRTDRRTSFSPTGGAQPKSDMTISRFTNCFITCLWPDGVNRTPSMSFTYNQQFPDDRRRTARHDAQLEHLMLSLELHGLDTDRVVNVGTAENERRTFVFESSSLVRLFFGNFGADKESVILSRPDITSNA